MKHSPLLIIFIVVLINSCSKSTDTIHNNQPDTSLLVKTLTEDFVHVDDPDDSWHYVYTLHYDNQNRLIKMESDSEHINFIYSNNIIEKDIYPKTNPPQRIYYYYKNALLDSSVIITESSPADTGYTTYNYDSENKLIHKKEISTEFYGRDTFSYTYTYDNKGNLINEYVTYSYGFYSSADLVYSDSANFSNSADIIYPDQIRSPNLLKSYFSDYWVPMSGGSTYYEYEFDNYHRIIKVSSSYDDHGNVFNDVYSYTYY